MTTALVNALNDVFDTAAAQRFAYQSGVPPELVLALYFAALLTIGALGYQFGVAGKRQEVLSLLLPIMWSGGILLIVDLSKPRCRRDTRGSRTTGLGNSRIRSEVGSERAADPNQCKLNKCTGKAWTWRLPFLSV